MVRIAERKLELLCVLDVPDNLKINVDDVLIGGQHQTVIVACPTAHAKALCAVGGNVKHLGSDQWPRRKVQTLGADPAEFTKEQLDRLFLRLNTVGGGEEPCGDDNHCADANHAARDLGRAATIARAAARAIGAATAAHQDAQLLLAFFHQLVELGDRGLVATAAIATVAAVIAATLWSAVIAAAVIAAA